MTEGVSMSYANTLADKHPSQLNGGNHGQQEAQLSQIDC